MACTFLNINYDRIACKCKLGMGLHAFLSSSLRHFVDNVLFPVGLLLVLGRQHRRRSPLGCMLELQSKQAFVCDEQQCIKSFSVEAIEKQGTDTGV